MTIPIILLMGPSGVGKTTLAEWIVEDLQYSHVDFDLWDGDTPEICLFRGAWDVYKCTGSVEELRQMTEQKVLTDHTAGAVLSFPSDDMTNDLELFRQAVAAQVYPVILYAAEDSCRQVFVAREAVNGRGLPVEHWNECNAHIYEPDYLTTAHVPYVVQAYDAAGQRRSRSELVAEVANRIK